MARPASYETQQKVMEIYSGVWGAVPDSEGLGYWVSRIDVGEFNYVDVAQSFFDQPLVQQKYAGLTGDAFLEALYLNLFKIDVPDTEGFAYWQAKVAADPTFLTTNVGNLVMQMIDGMWANEAAAETQALYRNFVTAGDLFYDEQLREGALFSDMSDFDKLQFLHASESLTAGITADMTQEDIVALVSNATDAGLPGGGEGPTFTLHEVDVTTYADLTIAIQPTITKLTYWGYDPHGHGNLDEVDNTDTPQTDNGSNESPADGGVPIADLINLIQTYASLDFVELGLINVTNDESADTTQFPDLSAVTNLTIGFAPEQEVDFNIDEGSEVRDATGTATITVTLNDGTINTAEVALGQMYFDFIHNLLFDSENNSRLYEETVVTYPQVPLLDADGNPVLDIDGNVVTVDLTEYVVSGAGEATGSVNYPIVLTPTQNNGGTYETGFTTAGDDTIIAGRLELLHQAYIDGGRGYNTLEIDAKGYYAQPLELLNIQQVNIENLPNVYTIPTDIGGFYDVSEGTSYPDLDPDQSISYTSSVIDLSRATSLERLVITEGNFNGLQVGHVEDPGTMTITGIRNGAVARFEGSFEQDVTLNYGEGLTGPLTVELLIGQITANLNFAHNTDALHLVSLGGVANSFGVEDLNGRLTQLKISGDAALYIRGDLDGSFQDETPITIDASENTGGVNLELSDSQNVTFYGSQGDDIFIVDTSEADILLDYVDDDSVTIIDGGGNNTFEIETEILNITLLDGNNKVSVDDAESIVITAGNGNNHFQIDDGSQATITVGDGNNRMEINADGFDSEGTVDDSIDYPNDIIITAGNGQNVIDVDADSNIGSVTVVAGNGGNDIDAVAHEISINTGSSADVMKVLGDIIVINSGGGGDTITVGGFDYDYVGTQELGGNASAGSGDSAEWGEDGALVQINAGADATIILGSDRDYVEMEDNDFPGVTSITAHEGSYISGENITLVVKSVADLRAAVLTGVTDVILDDDSFDLADAPLANQAVAGFNAAVLTVTADQFLALGADAFHVDGAIFNTHAFVKILVTDDTSLTALGVDALPRNIDLLLELQDGATLTMTAEQLHTRVAQNGITLANDGNTDYGNGSVIITGGGQDFDPFNTSDTIQSVINGTVYTGGSLSSDFMVNNSWYNVQVNSYVNGYDRPADVAAEVSITLDSTGNGTLTQGAFDSWHTNLEIVGNQDINFTGPVKLGMQLGVPTNPFNIDFAALEGVVNNFVVDNFELLAQGGSIVGNADNGYASEVHISIADDDGTDNVGFDESDAGTLHSSGVTRYVVTTIDGPTAAGSDGNTATITLCDTAQDIEVFALRGNYNDTLVIEDAAWGLAFELQGGGTAKAEGPTGTSNVGALVANYEWEGADAVVSLVHSVVGDTRPLYAEGITINNADSITINADGPAALIHDLNGDDFTTLDINADGNVSIQDALPGQVCVIDASDVVGTFSAALEHPESDLVFTGSQGGSTLHLNDVFLDSDAVIDGGVGGVVLVIVEDEAADLSDATLINVTGVVFEEDADLTLTMAQADAIGAENFSFAEGADDADLTLVGLDGEFFAVANYPEGVDVAVVRIADLPVVTLHPDTDLTGVGGLEVPEGVILNMTAEQFQQLGGSAFNGPVGFGQIEGVDGTTNFTVNITDLTQADVDVDYNNDGDPNDTGFPNFEVLNLSQVTADNKTITLAESIVLDSADDLAGFDVIMGDDMTLTLADIQQADGLNISGGSNTTLKFVDTSAGTTESIDASGFNVTTLMMLNVLVAERNVDLMFFGLQESVTKVIYNGVGWVDGVDQFAELAEGTTVEGWLVFNKPEADVEIQNFDLTLNGGTEIIGNLRLSSSANQDDLQQMDLQSVTIHSKVTADDPLTENVVEGANRYTGETANIITGDLTSQGTGNQGSYTSVDNDLLNVTIDAEEDFILEGSIIFESVTNNDVVTANDDDEATATLNVTGDADVTIGDLDTDDEDVDYLTINHDGTGSLTVGLSESAGTVDHDDLITFHGDEVGIDTIIVSGNLDLSDDILEYIDNLLLNQGANLVLTMDQYENLGSMLALNGAATAATISLVGFGSDNEFDATALPTGITVQSITLAEGDVVLDPLLVNLTNVGKIIIPEGGSLELTADQYAQLLSTGTIEVLNTDGNAGNDAASVLITGLTQAIVDGPGFDITQVDDDISLTVTLGEDRVNLGTYDENGDLIYAANLDSAGYPNPPDASFILADGQTLGVVNNSQADFLVVTSESALNVANTTLVWMFDSVPNGANEVINASNYSVSTLKALNVLVNGTNIESMISELDSDVTLQIYFNPEDLGLLNPTLRVVVVEEGVTVDGSLMFNDPDSDDEVQTLSLSLLGGVVIDGDILLSTTNPKDWDPMYFQKLFINSEGTAENYLESLNGNHVFTNIITGNIDADWDGGLPAVPPAVREENNLLNIEITATQDLEIQGQIAFDAVDPDGDDAYLTITGTSTADITIGQLDILDEEVDSLTIANNGAGTLTVTGTSPAIVADTGENFETLVLKGTGDVVLGTTSNESISAGSLSLIDASELDGNLTLNEVGDIDSFDFSFIAGSGVTTLTLTDDNLNADGSWSFNFTSAAAGSEFHLAPDWVPADYVDGAALTINMGDFAVLYIDRTMDLSALNLDITSVQAIVVADGVTLTLDADQADGLTIIGESGSSSTGLVELVGLGDDATDLSGISADIAGHVHLEDNDVSLHVDTDLGAFTVHLLDVANDLSSSTANELLGQTIRFSTTAQAERAIEVDANDGAGSTNVVWLFDKATFDAHGGPINTDLYAPGLDRLWFYAHLVDGENVEQLFSSLPNAILRVEVDTLEALAAPLDESIGVDRTIELVAFSDLPLGLTFNDEDQFEHIQSLTINMGGEATVGPIEIDNVVNPALVGDPDAIVFNELTINSWLADDTGDLLASELFDEAVHVKPVAPNVVGDISVGSEIPGLDLMTVTLDTHEALSGNDLTTTTTNVLTGNDLEVGTITFDSEVAASFASLTVSGANDIDIDSVNTDDADIIDVTVTNSGFTGTLTAPGASPAFQLNNTEALLFETVGSGDSSTITLGSDVNAGVVGDTLSLIDASTYVGELDLGIIAMVDGTDDEAFDYNGDGDTDDDYEDANIAFTLIGNGTENTTYATLGMANGLTPTLAAGSTWHFEDVNLRITEDVIFEDGAILEFNNVNLTIDDGVDLSRVEIIWLGANNVNVLEGQSLTLTVDQVLALNGDSFMNPAPLVTPAATPIEIVGSGTVNIVGDATTLYVPEWLSVSDSMDDLDLMYWLGRPLDTVNVNLEGITIDTGEDLGGGFSLLLDDATDDEGLVAGNHITGSDFNDLLTVFGEEGVIAAPPIVLSETNEGATFDGGLGNDIYNAFWAYGSDTFVVDEGTDIIFDLYGDDPTDPYFVANPDELEQDILQVATGATAYGMVLGYDYYGNSYEPTFVASDETFNNGTAVLIGQLGGEDFQTTIDVSQATGDNGFTLIGSSAAGGMYAGDFFESTLAGIEDLALGQGGLGWSSLSGSNNDDIIMGGNSAYNGNIDVLTGNGGADLFVFDVSVSSAAILTVETTTAAIDSEVITITADSGNASSGGADDNNEHFIVQYDINSLADQTVDIDLSGVDVTSATAIGTAVATALNGVSGLNAASVAGVVTVTGEAGNAIHFDSVTPTGTFDTLAGGISNGTDQAQVTTLTVNGTPTQGDLYNFNLEEKIGGGGTGNATADATPTTDEVAYDLEGTYVAVNVSSAVVGSVITFTQTAADNGGFTVLTDTTAAFAGSGASNTGATDLATADVITDFATGVDTISFGMNVGTGWYAEDAAGAADYTEALTDADTAFNGTVMYFLTNSVADDTGLLFFDANLDGDVDGVVALTGITAANFAAADIVA